MKSFFKTAFFIAFVLIFVSCGEKKSVYSQYPDPSDSESDVPAADNDGAKTDSGTESGEDAASDSDEIDDTDISGGDAPVSDEDIPADSDNPADDEDNTAETDGDSSETDSDTDELLNCTGFSLDPDDKLSGWLPSTIYTIKIDGNILGNTDYEDFLQLRLDHKRFDGDPYVAAGTYDLADGDSWHNTNYWACWECVSVTQDRQQDSEKFYFQKSGTLTIESVDSKYNFKGTLSAVLIESAVVNWTTEPVENGECIEIETYFEAETFCSPDCSGKENGESDGCGGFCGEGCGETDECQSNRECDPGYYCGNDCHCYIENPDD